MSCNEYMNVTIKYNVNKESSPTSHATKFSARIKNDLTSASHDTVVFLLNFFLKQLLKYFKNPDLCNRHVHYIQ